MFHTRTCRFKVETSWQELVNRRIHAIEINLKEISFLNQGEFLIAKGAFKREIVYVEFDGRYRKVDDKVQFEVVVGKAVGEPLPLFKTELKQDYFIYQPRQIGDNQAVLEQAFLLIVQEVEVDVPPEVIEPLFLDCVVEQRNFSRLVRIPVTIDDGLEHFNDFTGNIAFEPFANRLISGKVVGSIQFLTSDHRIAMLPVEQSFSWLNEEPEKEFLFNQNMRIEGTIKDTAWVKLDTTHGEIEFKVNYSMVSIESSPLNCVLMGAGQENKHSPLAYPIKSQALLGDKEYRFGKSYRFFWDFRLPFEIKVVIGERKDRLTKKGILLESSVKIEAYYQNEDGLEAYYQWDVELFDLIEDVLGIEKKNQLRLNTALRIEQIVFSQREQELWVDFNAVYRVQLLESKIVKVVEDSKKGRAIVAKTLVEQKNFSAMRETIFFLRRKPLYIQGIQSQLVNVRSIPKSGWMHIIGEISFTFNYIHLSGKTYTEQYKAQIDESFIWERLTENRVEVEVEPKLEFSTYELDGTKINYKYLIRYEAGLFMEREFKIKVLPSLLTPFQLRPVPIDRALEAEEPIAEELTFVFEKEIPLKLGNPREIARNKAFLAHFDCRDAQNALLTEGILGTDLEYWDEDGFLRQERIDVPFWKFIQYSPEFHKSSPGFSFFPEILRSSVSPINAWPWQKGTVKVQVELSLKRNKGGEPL